MKNINYLVFSLIFLVFLNSCGMVKDGFSLQKKDNSDEFLVEKKNPLKLPPKFDELPVPNSGDEMNDSKKDVEIKSLLTNSESGENDTGSNNKNLQEMILDKIKKN